MKAFVIFIFLIFAAQASLANEIVIKGFSGQIYNNTNVLANSLTISLNFSCYNRSHWGGKQSCEHDFNTAISARVDNSGHFNFGEIRFLRGDLMSVRITVSTSQSLTRDSSLAGTSYSKSFKFNRLSNTELTDAVNQLLSEYTKISLYKIEEHQLIVDLQNSNADNKTWLENKGSQTYGSFAFKFADDPFAQQSSRATAEPMTIVLQSGQPSEYRQDVKVDSFGPALVALPGDLGKQPNYSAFIDVRNIELLPGEILHSYDLRNQNFTGTLPKVAVTIAADALQFRRGTRNLSDTYTGRLVLGTGSHPQVYQVSMQVSCNNGLASGHFTLVGDEFGHPMHSRSSLSGSCNDNAANLEFKVNSRVVTARVSGVEIQTSRKVLRGSSKMKPYYIYLESWGGDVAGHLDTMSSSLVLR